MSEVLDSLETKKIEKPKDLHLDDQFMKSLKVANLLKNATLSQNSFSVSMLILVVALVALLIAAGSFFSISVKTTISSFESQLATVTKNQAEFGKKLDDFLDKAKSP